MGRSLLAASLGLAASVGAYKVHPQSMQLSVGAVGVLTTEPQRCVDWQSSDSSVVVSPFSTDMKCQLGSSAAYLFAKSLPDQGETIISTVQVRDVLGNTASATIYVGHVNELQISYSSDVLPTGAFGELKLSTLDDDGGKQVAVGRAFAAAVFPIQRCNDKHCTELARELSTAPLPSSDSSVVDICSIRRLAGSEQPPSPELNIRYSAEKGQTPLTDMPSLAEYPTEQVFSDVLLVAGGKRPGRVAVCVQLVPSSLETVSASTGRHTLCQPLAITDRLHTQPQGPLAMALGSTVQLCLFRSVADGSVELAEGLATDCGWPVQRTTKGDKSGAPGQKDTGANETAAVNLLLHDPNHTWLSTDSSVLRVDNGAPGVVSAVTTGSVHVIVLDDRLASTDLHRPLEGYTLACASAVSSGASLPKGCTDMSNGFDLIAKVDRLDGVQVWSEPVPRVVGYRSALAGLVGAYPTLGEATTSSVASPNTANALPDWDYRISPGLQYVTPAVQAVHLARSAGKVATVRCTGTTGSTCKPVSVPKADSEETKPSPVLQLVAGQAYAFHVQATGESGSRLVLGHTLRSEVTFTDPRGDEHNKRVNISLLSAPAPLQRESCQSASTSAEVTSSGYFFRVLPCAGGALRMRVVLTDRNAKSPPLELAADVLVRESVQLVWPVSVHSLSTKALNMSASMSKSVSSLGTGSQGTAEATKQVPVLLLPVVLGNADITPAKLRLRATGGTGAFTFRTSVLKPTGSGTGTGTTSGNAPTTSAPRPCMAGMSGSCEKTAVKVDATGVLSVIQGPESVGETGVEIVDGSDAGNGHLLAVRTAAPKTLAFGAQKVEMDVGEDVYVPIFAKDAASMSFDICDNLAAGLKWSVSSAAVGGSGQDPSVAIMTKGWTKDGARPGVSAETLPVVDSACGYVRVQGIKTGASRLSVSLKVGPGQELEAFLHIDVYHPLKLVYPAPSSNPATVKDEYHVAVGSSLAAAVLGGPQAFGPEALMVQQVFAHACVHGPVGKGAPQPSCGQATDVHVVHASNRAATIASGHGVQILLESVKAALEPPSAAPAGKAGAALPSSTRMAPAYLFRLQCTASSQGQVEVSLRLGSKPHKDSFKSMPPSAALPVLRLKLVCSHISSLRAVVMPEAAAYAAYAASVASSGSPFSLHSASTAQQHVLYTGEPAILSVSAVSADGSPFINASGVQLAIAHTPTVLAGAEAVHSDSEASVDNSTVKQSVSQAGVSILHLASQPYFFGQLTPDWGSQSVAAKAAKHMQRAGAYAWPTLEELLFLYGGPAQFFRVPAVPLGLVAPLRIAGPVAPSLDNWSQEEKYWVLTAHTGVVAAGMEVSTVPGAAVLRVSLKSSPETQTVTVVISGAPAALVPTALPLYSLAGSTATFTCVGGSGVHTFSVNGTPVSGTSSRISAGIVTAGITSGASSKLLAAVPTALQSTTLQLTSTGEGEGRLTVACGDDLVFGKGLSGKPLTGTVHVATAKEVTVSAPRLMGLGTTAALEIKVHTADGLVFPSGQLTRMNISLHVAKGSAGGPETVGVLVDKTMGSLTILDTTTVLIEQYWSTAGELRFNVTGKTVGAVYISVALSRCSEDACEVLQSTARSLYVYPPLQAYPPAPVLLPDAGLQLQILGGPPGGFGSSDVAVRFSVDHPDLLLVTSDGVLQSLGGEGNATVRAQLVPAEEAGQVPHTVYGTVIIPVRVCKPSVVRLYVQGADVVSDRSLRWTVLVADSTVQLAWDTPEGHGPLSIAGLGDKVKVQWGIGTASRGDGITQAPPWASTEDVRPFRLLSRAHPPAHGDEATSRTVQGLSTAMYVAHVQQAAHCRLSMTLSFTSSQYGPMLFTTTIAVGLIPRAQLLYPAPLAEFAQGVHLLLPVGSVARPVTNLHALFGNNISVALSTGSMASSEDAKAVTSVLACSAKKGDMLALMRMQIAPSPSSPATQDMWRLLPVQAIAMEVECARPRDVIVVPSSSTPSSAGSGSGSVVRTAAPGKPGAELSIAYHALQTFRVVAVDATGRVFGSGLAALCPLGSAVHPPTRSAAAPASANASASQHCTPSTIGLLAYSSLPAVTSASLSFDKNQDAVLTVRAEGVGMSLVHVVSQAWTGHGSGHAPANGDTYAGAGDSMTVSVRASVLPAGIVTLLPGSEVRLEVSADTLAHQLELLAGSKEHSKMTMDSLKALVRWTVSNETVAVSLPEWPKIKHGSSSKKRSHATGFLWGRVVALAGGTTVATATVKLPGASQTVLTLGSATITVVIPSDVHAVLVSAPLHEIEAGTYPYSPLSGAPSSWSTGKKMVLSDVQAGSAGALSPNGAAGVVTSITQSTSSDSGIHGGTTATPSVFLLRLLARSAKSGTLTELHSNDFVTHRLSFECGVQVNAVEGGNIAGGTGKEVQSAWFASASIGPGAVHHSGRWTVNENHTAAEALVDYELSSSETAAGGKQEDALTSQLYTHLNAARPTWPSMSKHARLCVISPRTAHLDNAPGMPPVPAPTRITVSAKVQLFAPARLYETQSGLLGTGAVDKGAAFQSVVLQPATQLAAPFKAAVRVVPLALAKGIVDSGSATVLHYDSSTRSSLGAAGPADGSIQAKGLITLSKGLPALDSPIVLGTATGKSSVSLVTYNTGASCTLGSVDSRLHARIQPVSIVEGRRVAVAGWVPSPVQEVLDKVCKGARAGDAVHACPACLLTVSVAPHILESAVGSQKSGSGSSLSFAWASVAVQDGNGRPLPLFFAFDDAKHAITPKQASGEATAASGSSEEVVKAQAEAQARQKSKAASARMAHNIAARAGLPQPTASAVDPGMSLWTMAQYVLLTVLLAVLVTFVVSGMQDSGGLRPPAVVPLQPVQTANPVAAAAAAAAGAAAPPVKPVAPVNRAQTTLPELRPAFAVPPPGAPLSGTQTGPAQALGQGQPQAGGDGPMRMTELGGRQPAAAWGGFSPARAPRAGLGLYGAQR